MTERVGKGFKPSGGNWVESLESRALLATGAFTAPDISGLIRQAVHHGVNTGPTVISEMTTALQDQLTTGPLASLQAGTITESVFQTDVATVVAGYDQCVADLLGGRFPHITEILTLKGATIGSDLDALAAEQAASLTDSAGYTQQAAAAIDTLTSGPLLTLHTPYSGYVSATQGFEDRLKTLVAGLDPSATTPLTLTEVQTLVPAYAASYRSNMESALDLKPGVYGRVNQALTDLESATAALTETDAQTGLQAAVDAFDSAVLDTTGLFGPQGPVVWHLHSNGHS